MNITPENLKFAKEWLESKGIKQGFTQVQQTQLAVEWLAENGLLVDDSKETKQKAAAVLYPVMNGSAARQKFESLKYLAKTESTGKSADAIAAKFAAAFD